MQINADLENMYKWLNLINLKIIVFKSKCMSISKNHVLNVSSVILNNSAIERVKSITYLGVVIDKNLNFQDHLTADKRKISSKIS